MKRTRGARVLVPLVSVCLLCVSVASVFGEEYAALKGVKSVKAVFDVRTGAPKSADLLLKLIHRTRKEKEILAITKKPEFVLVFIGPSVKLVSKHREGFSPEDQKVLDSIADTISEMSKDGIRLELCLAAAEVFGVDPASVLPEIKRVPNGWTSLIGYEAKGYSLVPVY